MRKMMLIVFVFLLLAGCAGQAISRNSAEKIGREFVGERAKFFVSGENGSLNVSNYRFSEIHSYANGDLWVVIVRVESQINSSSKSANITVEIDKLSGKVTRFNGIPVSK